MLDERTRQSVEFLDWWFKEHGQPQGDASVERDLEQATGDYLKWMSQQGYSTATIENYRSTLNQFFIFIKCRSFSWDEIFTIHTLERFQEVRALKCIAGVKGLSRYLYEKGKIDAPIPKRKVPVKLPPIYEQYLAQHRQSKQASEKKITAIRRVLVLFDDHLEKQAIQPRQLRIEQVDAFLAQSHADFSESTKKCYRGYLRGFLSYLHERRITRTDLAPMVVGRRVYGRSKPPKFYRPEEVQKLFASLKLSSSTEVRTYAMVHLAFALGLRPAEISKITLDDVSFGKAELTLRDRKGGNPISLPVPEHALKAVAAYLIGARPKSPCRTVFLSFHPPHGPINPGLIGCYITKSMRQAGLCGTAYWLRHTYAQNLLEAGASVYEIKEMLGHDRIESSKAYLQIHTKLMREVLFDETL
jgi:integrase/recombinase XerD